MNTLQTLHHLPQTHKLGRLKFYINRYRLEKVACFGLLAALSLNSVEKWVRFSNLLVYPYPAK